MHWCRMGSKHKEMIGMNYIGERVLKDHFDSVAFAMGVLDEARLS